MTIKTERAAHAELHRAADERTRWADVLCTKPNDIPRINADNERRIKRADRAVNALFAFLLGIIGAVLLVHWLSQCNGAPAC